MVKNVLILCTGNSARSIFGECLITNLSDGKYLGFSAGSTPTGTVNPTALRLLKSKGYDTSNYHSKSWNEFGDPSSNPFDIIITVCDNAASETCPIWPGSPISAHWGLPDPAGVGETEIEKMQAFEVAYRTIKKRVEAFLALGDHEITKDKLNEIGKF